MISTALVSSAAEIAAFAIFGVAAVVLAVIDARTHRLPDRLVLPLYPVAAVLLTAAALSGGEPLRLLGSAGGGVALFAFFLLLRMLRPGAMGGGDVKLAGAIGIHLGYLGWDAVLLGTIAAFVLGGAAAVVLLATRRARRSTAIPFGPWMLAGAWVAVVASALQWLRPS